MQSGANNRSGVIDAGRSERHDHIVVSQRHKLVNLFQRTHVCQKTCDIHDPREL